MSNNFFPFHVHYSNAYGGGPNAYRKAFNENKPEFYEETIGSGKTAWTHKKKFIYYQFEVIVHSQTSVEFVCYDMKDSCYGGRGKEIHRFMATVDESVTKESIENMLMKRAAYRREAELLRAERMIINSYAAQEAKMLGLKL